MSREIDRKMWEDDGRSQGFSLEGGGWLLGLAHFSLLHILRGLYFHTSGSGSTYRPHFRGCWPLLMSSEGRLGHSYILMSYLSFVLSLPQELCLISFGYRYWGILGFPRGSVAKNLLAVQETQVRTLGWEDLLQEGMATHSSILAWRIP